MENYPSLFKYKMSGTSGFVLVLLVLALIGLGERVLYDLSRIFAGPDFSYFDDLATLLVHTVFVMILIVLAVVINVTVSEKKEKYAIVLIPYFILAIALTIQVSLEAAVYFYFHHTQFQFYLIMSSLVVVCSMLVYVIQRNYLPVEVPVSSYRPGFTVIFWVLGVLLGIPLLLYVLAMLFFRFSF